MRWSEGGDRAANALTGWAIFGILGALAANRGDKRFVCRSCGTLV